MQSTLQPSNLRQLKFNVKLQSRQLCRSNVKNYFDCPVNVELITAAKDTASTVEATNTEIVTVANQFTTAIREVITTSDARELSHPPTQEITAFPKATSDFTTEPEPDVTAPPVITTTPDVQHRGLKCKFF